MANSSAFNCVLGIQKKVILYISPGQEMYLLAQEMYLLACVFYSWILCKTFGYFTRKSIHFSGDEYLHLQ